MTMGVAPKTEVLRKEVQEKYAEVAVNPDQTFHFHHGRPLAEILGYAMVLIMPTGKKLLDPGGFLLASSGIQ